MNKTILLLLIIPIVSAETPVLITVVDPLANLVDGASLQIYCTNARQSGTTDQFGTYYALLPEENCKAYARFKDAVGVQSFIANKSQEITITLDKTIITIPKTIPVWPFVVFLILLICIGAIIYLRRHKKIVQKAICPVPVKDKKFDAILDVLSDREKQIVQHLLKHKGQSTQAKIRYDTGLPKASLSRNIKNLEAKNVVSVQSIGNLKRITLK